MKHKSHVTNRVIKLVSLGAILGVFAVTFASAQGIQTKIDGQLLTFPDVQPMLTANHVMVPMRGVFEKLNATLEWDEQSSTVTAQRGQENIRLTINSMHATVNGKDVMMETPATKMMGRTMVPLRFLSEALGANVLWIEATHTVEITTGAAPTTTTMNYKQLQIGTVIPFVLKTGLSSNGSIVGDKFTASLDSIDAAGYQGLPAGAILEGHVDTATAKTADMPGILGLTFDHIRMPNGAQLAISGALIGLDSASVENKDGRLVAKPGAKKDNLKYVGYGAGIGALVAVLTKGNVVTDTLIGTALGLLFGEIQKDPAKAHDVTSDAGMKFGVRVTQTFAFPSTTSKF